jgi:WD40 repeat protein
MPLLHPPRGRLAAVLLCALGAAGCENPATPPTPGPGTLLVSVETVGDLPDPDGYEITRNGVAIGRVGTSGTLRMEDLEDGSYSIGLRGASLYCGLDGDSVRQAALQRGATTTVAFRMECRRNGIAYLAWGTGLELWVHFPGRSPQMLANGLPAVPVSWSPDGRRIAYTALIGEGREIMTIDLDSLLPRRVTPQGGYAPAWSPDGVTIAYIRDRELRTIGVDGENDRRLWSTPVLSIKSVGVSWSPDGRRLGFRRFGVNGHRDDIVIVDPEGTEFRILRQLHEVGTGVTWSPDGTRIVYEDAPSGSPAQLYSAEVTTGAETLLHQVPGSYIRGPSHLRNGRIGFTTLPLDGSARRLWTIAPDGSGRTEHALPPGLVSFTFPAWQ